LSIISALKQAFASGAKELNKEYGKTSDFLNAVCASCALVAYLLAVARQDYLD